MNITVFLGASYGNNVSYANATRELGTWIGKNGHTLIYGGSKTGLMGVVAQSTLNAGGKAIGIETQFFVDAEVQFEGLTQLIVTPDMATRRKKLIRMGQAYVIMPGGMGTLEEFAECLSRKALDHLTAPCIFFSLNGYYDDLEKFLRNTVDKCFCTKDKLKDVYFVGSMEEAAEILTKHAKEVA